MADQPRQEDIDELMKVLAGAQTVQGSEPAPAPAEPAPVAAAAPAPAPVAPAAAGLEFLGDVDVQVRVELGHSKMNVEEVLKLGSGSIVPLESRIGDAVSVFVNDRLVARGEVLVVRDNFAIRITEIVPAGRNGA